MIEYQELVAEIERLQAEIDRAWGIIHQKSAEIERLQEWEDEHSRTEGGECPYCEIDRLEEAIEQLELQLLDYRCP
jgi:hypothetical protein